MIIKNDHKINCALLACICTRVSKRRVSLIGLAKQIVIRWDSQKFRHNGYLPLGGRAREPMFRELRMRC